VRLRQSSLWWRRWRVTRGLLAGSRQGLATAATSPRRSLLGSGLRVGADPRLVCRVRVALLPGDALLVTWTWRSSERHSRSAEEEPYGDCRTNDGLSHIPPSRILYRAGEANDSVISEQEERGLAGSAPVNFRGDEGPPPM
jgi:hypothetical protein